MTIAEQINQDLTTAMKAKDAAKVSVLRMAKAALGNYQIEKKKERLEDQDVVAVLQKQAKQRQESLESFTKAGRKDLADKEQHEFGILMTYLPKPLTDAEITVLAEKAIATSGAKTKADMGKVMKILMPSVQGKADGKHVNEILQQLLP